MFSPSAFTTDQQLAAGNPITVPLQAVGPQTASSAFGFYNTTPESPDGTRIAYVRYLEEPTRPKDGRPAELWLCDSDLSNHRRLTSIPRVAAHNGAEVLWVNNEALAFTTTWGSEPRTLRVIDATSGADQVPPVQGLTDFGHNAHEDKVLMAVDCRTVQANRREFGIYEWDTRRGAIRLLLSLEGLARSDVDMPPAALQASGLYPSWSDWRIYHLQYSPDGQKIAFRLDIGAEEPSRMLLALSLTDGDLHVFNKKLLHFLWYDNDSIAGHDKENRVLLPVRYTWTGEYMEVIAPLPGNHFAISPDGQSFVSENDYRTNPVVLKYYHKGDAQPRCLVAQFAPGDVVWERLFHVNPSFSRDGCCIYFQMPCSANYSGTYVANIAAECRAMNSCLQPLSKHDMATPELRQPPMPSQATMLWKDDFENLDRWIVQMEDCIEAARDGVVQVLRGHLEIYAPDRGCTVWFAEKLAGAISISYDWCCPSARLDPPHVAVRDMNCFWMALDPSEPGAILDANRYSGSFPAYHGIQAYYASMGGGGLDRDYNQTTRLRRYPRERAGSPAKHILLCDKDHQPNFLLAPDIWRHVELTAVRGNVTFRVDGRLVYQLLDGEHVPLTIDDHSIGEEVYGPLNFRPYEEGYFGFRLVRSHHLIRNFRITHPQDND